MTKFHRNPQWIYRAIGNEKQGLLIPLVATKADLSVVMQLNESAALIWSALETPASVDEIVENFRKNFEGESIPAEVEQDVLGCIQEMQREQIIEAREL